MKRFKKLLSMVSAFLILISMTPTQVTAAEADATSNYAANEFTELQSFLNQTSATPGKLNGDMISTTVYNPNNPETWTGVKWSTEVPKHVESIGVLGEWNSKTLQGALDLNDFTLLESVDVGDNQLTGITLTNMDELVNLYCNNNRITSLDLTGSPYLYRVECQNNLLDYLDLSGQRSLFFLESYNNHLIGIKAYFVEGIYYVDADYGGCVELRLVRGDGTSMALATAVPMLGAELQTWVLVREWDYGDSNPIDLYELGVDRAEAVFTEGEGEGGEYRYYTVTFDLNGGTTGTSAALTQAVREGRAAVAPSVYRNGYTFDGWDRSFSEVTSNMVVKAQWNGPSVSPYPEVSPYPSPSPAPSAPVAPISVTYLVTFDLNGGTRTGAGEAKQLIVVGGNAFAPTVTRDGYLFKGWDKTYTNIQDAITVTANWEPLDYTVTFDPNGGEKTGGGELIQKVATGSAATAPVVTREGYNFDEWDNDFSKVSKDLTVKALWNAKKFTVTFDPDGGTRTSGGKLVQNVEYNGSAVEPILEKDGYTFEEWDMDYTVVTEDITVTAIWAEIEPEESPVYKVTYDLNGGNGDTPVDENEYLEGDTSTLADGTGRDYDNFVFLGWALTPDGEVLSEDSITVDDDTTLYAIWEEIVVDVPKTGEIPGALNYGIPMLFSGSALIGLSVIRKRKYRK